MGVPFYRADGEGQVLYQVLYIESRYTAGGAFAFDGAFQCELRDS
jgi:hypothetical protein